MKEACIQAQNVTKPKESLEADPKVSVYDKSNLEAIARAGNVFYNHSKTCLDIHEGQSGGLDTSAWTIQTCSEFPMP